MRLTRLLRPLLACVALLAVAGCATRHAIALKPLVTVSPTPVWRIQVGDVIKTKVYREPELSGDAPVTESGSAFFAGLGRVQVAGLSLDSLQTLVEAKYAKLIIDPAVDVQFTREVVIYGQVRTPAIVTVDQSTTVLGLLAKAGGALGTGREPVLSLVKSNGAVYTLPREARLSSIDMTRGDAVYVTDDNFFSRNASSISSLYIMSTLISSSLGLIFTVFR